MAKYIAIFASGDGTNAQNIINYFKDSNYGKVSLVLSNKPDAYVLERAKKYGIPSFTFTSENLYNSHDVLNKLTEYQIDFIVLAGFLLLIPQNIIKKYKNKIINIHPALLPKHGGKGMYGMKVHKAVIENKEKESGITIHYVNEKYDEGSIIFQTRCKVEKNYSPEILAEKVHNLEYEHFPVIIEKLIKKN
ncbi:MAG: phosphoribosylglycinamide formyltransferase [Bacteroidales bacterium]|nr:phosphoribosylglycinamide formyltransferase [Bacteroidales bacterium]